MSRLTKPIWILEMGQNHNGNMQIAAFMIDRISKMNPDYLKVQVYDSNKIFEGDEEYYVHSMQAELTKAQLDYIAALLVACNIHNGTSTKLLASPFDGQRLNWWIETYTKYWKDSEYIPIKIASRMAANTEFLKIIRGYRLHGMFRPLHGIISHGMEYLDKELYNKYFDKHEHLFCKSSYPCTYTPDDWANFEEGLANGTYEGISDHSIGEDSIRRALAAGAGIIERHVTWVHPPAKRYALYQSRHNKPDDKIAGMSFEEWLSYDQRMTGPDHICSSHLDDIEALILENK